MHPEEDPEDNYCQNLVRQWDNDRYLTVLLAPSAMRSQLSALYAFDIEVARIRGLVSEPGIGEIRYQWWSDAIDGLYQKRQVDHPVIAGLAQAVEHADLPKHAFSNLIEARRFDLYDDPMPSLNDLEGYLGETSSILMQMAVQLLAGEAAFPLTDITGPAGVAYGLCKLMCGLPVHRARGQCYIPVDLLEKCDLTPAHIIAGRWEPAIDLVFSRLRHHTQIRLMEARKRISDVPVAALPALWPMSLVDLYLKKLSGSSFNPLEKSAEVSQVRRQFRLMKMSLIEAF